MELFLLSLAVGTRWRRLNLIGEDEVCVCYLVKLIGTNQPKISRHLAILMNAGLVSVRRDWKWSHYQITKLAESLAARVFEEALNLLKHDPEMQEDKKQMAKTCCAPPPKQPISIQGAPRPESAAV